jgi:phosphatidylinositol-3-phosphatase
MTNNSRCVKRVSQTVVVVLALVLLLPLVASAQGKIPRPDHIVVVIEENRAFKQIIGNLKEAPYINELAEKGASFTSFFALRHPSQSNYILLFSGDRQGVKGDGCLESKPAFLAHSLGGELINNGLSFKGYADDLPTPGATVCKSGDYVRKHAPWVDFADVKPQTDLSLPFSAFPTDFSKLPTLSFVIPNLDNDMHDGSIARGDKWLKDKVGAYVEWAKTNNSLLIVTWDEDNKHCGGILHSPCDTKPPAKNRIPAIFVGPMVKPGKYDQQYTHLDLLRTLEEMYGLPLLGASQSATAITGVWN